MKLKVSKLSKSFYDKTVLNNVNFEFEQGKIYGIIGRNGAGKTTFFNCLSGDMKPDNGTSELILKAETRQLSRTDVGYVTSLPVLPDFLTGYEFVKIMLDISTSQISIDDAFNLVRLNKDDQNKLIKNYSHGMKNKIQMLCFIVSQAPIIFLDEPLTSLDVIVAKEMKDIIRNLKSERIIIFSTHILPLATELCDELVVLNGGKFLLLDRNKLADKTFEDEVINMLSDVDGDEYD